MAPPSNLGVIESQSGYRYQLTPNDLLWLGRAVQFEGGGHEATIWTYAQRAALYRTASLAQLLRNHSQPINPYWATAGEGGCARNPEMCTDRHIIRRLEARSTSWEHLRPEVRAKVLAFARAELDNPVPRAVDFASYNIEAWFRRHPDSRKVGQYGANWHVTTTASNDWPADFVTLRFGDRVAGAVAGIGFAGGLAIGALAAVAGAGAYYAWKQLS